MNIRSIIEKIVLPNLWFRQAKLLRLRSKLDDTPWTNISDLSEKEREILPRLIAALQSEALVDNFIIFPEDNLLKIFGLFGEDVGDLILEVSGNRINVHDHEITVLKLLKIIAQQ